MTSFVDHQRLVPTSSEGILAFEDQQRLALISHEWTQLVEPDSVRDVGSNPTEDTAAAPHAVIIDINWRILQIHNY